MAQPEEEQNQSWYGERHQPTCERCGKLYSYRTWLIVAPECKEMCDPCEREIRAAASLVGVIGLGLAIAAGEKARAYRDRNLTDYPTSDLWNADPECKHEVEHASGGGVKCRKCGGWKCL